MQTINQVEYEHREEELEMKIIRGAVFVHPTDTIYGLGCNAKDSAAVRRIRDIKERQDQPFSVIAPSLRWIRDNCVITPEAEEWMHKLPGPYTLILKLRDKSCVASEVIPGLDSLGVRIPDHWFAKAATRLQIPIVTTSANVTGKEFMTSIDDIDPKIASNVDFVVYEGRKESRPSKIVNLAGGEAQIRER